MRPTPPSFPRIPLILLALAAGLPATAGEIATVRLPLEGRVDAGQQVTIENLLGSVRVVPGRDPDRVVVDARVLAEARTEEEARRLAATISVEPTRTAAGLTFHVAFPVADHAAFRSPRKGVEGVVGRWMAPLGGKDSTFVYDGSHVHVLAGRKAAGLAVHLTVGVPADLTVVVRQSSGTIDARAVRGQLELAAIDGEIRVERCLGSLTAHTERGALHVIGFQGEKIVARAEQGRLEIRDVRAEQVRLESDSGAIRGSGLTTARLVIESTSGDVRMEGVEPTDASIRSDSGDLDLATNLKTLSQAEIRSVSGDVTLRVGPLTHFDLLARSASGEVRTLGLDLDLVGPDETATRLRRGRGGPLLAISALGGKVTLRPYEGSRLDLLVSDSTR